MNHLNSVLIEGIVTADPRLVTTSAKNGSSLVKFTLASDRYYYDREKQLKVDTIFISVQAWGGLGDAVLKFMSKGMLVRVVGRLRRATRQKKDGSMYDVVEILAQHVEYRKQKKTEREELKDIEEDSIIDNEDEAIALDAGVEDAVEEPIVMYDFD